MSLYETYLSKSKEYLINEIFNSWERNKSLQHQLEIQTKRVENLKKSNEFYADTSNWVQESYSSYPQFIGKNDSEIQDYELIAGKLARAIQVKDQELEKQLEEVKC